MTKILSNKIYSPQNFLEIMTGKTFIIDSDDDDKYIHKILRQEGIEDDEYPIHDYSLNEITSITNLDTYVVLVDCLIYNKTTDCYENNYRWFECGDDFEGKEEEVNNI